jgi:hypothetical protein
MPETASGGGGGQQDSSEQQKSKQSVDEKELKLDQMETFMANERNFLA